MEPTERSIIILALDNLINTYSIALENKDTCQNEEELQLIQFTIDKAKEILYNMSQDTETDKPINKPIWENL
jgi:hypothetical protein